MHRRTYGLRKFGETNMDMIGVRTFKGGGGVGGMLPFEILRNRVSL